MIDFPSSNSYKSTMTKPLSPKTVTRIMRQIAKGKANDVNPTTLKKIMQGMGRAKGDRKKRDEFHYTITLPMARKKAAQKRAEKENEKKS